MESKLAEALVPADVVRGELNGLGVVRSLAEGRVPTIVVDTTLRHAPMWSCWMQASHRRAAFRKILRRRFAEIATTARYPPGADPDRRNVGRYRFRIPDRACAPLPFPNAFAGDSVDALQQSVVPDVRRNA